MNEDLSILSNLIEYLKRLPPDTKVFTIADCNGPLSLTSYYKRVKLAEYFIDYDVTNKTLTIGN